MATSFDPQAQDVLLCEECDERPAQHHCLACVGHLCRPCKDAHLRRKISSGHKIVPFTSDLVIYGNCLEHPKCKYEVFCHPCNEPICSECRMETHNGHKVEDLQEVFSRRKEFILHEIENIEKNIIPNEHNRLTKKRKEVTDMKAAADTLERDMIAQSDNLIVHIKGILKQRLKIAKSHASSRIKDLQSQEKILERNIKEFENVKQNLEREIEIRIATDFLMSTKDIMAIDTKDRSDVTYILPKFYPAAVQNIGVDSHFGIFVQSNVRVMKGHIMNNLEEVNTIETNSKNHWGLQCIDRCSVWLRNEEAFITKLQTNNSEAMDENRKIVCSTRPSGLCIDTNSVLYSDYENKQIARVIFAELKPGGIHVSKFGYILVCFPKVMHSGKIVKYKDNGSILSEMVGEFEKPGYVTENVNCDICISDISLGKVIVLDHYGNSRFWYDGRCTGYNLQSFTPKELDTDSLGNIVVADEGNDCLHVISRDGAFLTCLFIHNNDIGRPRGLSIDSEDKAWVTGFNGGSIKVYKFLK